MEATAAIFWRSHWGWYRKAADMRRRGTLLSTGFLGTPMALDALAEHDHEDLVWALLERSEFPSWGYMATRGATTIWERRNGDTGDVTMNSFNHYALGAVCGFLYRRIAGIAPLEPGWSKFAVRPLVNGTAKSAGASCDTVRGRVEVNWKLGAHALELQLTVPPNSEAHVDVSGFAATDSASTTRLYSGKHSLRLHRV